jgi:glycyl-tRNA synthetase beta chain
MAPAEFSIANPADYTELCRQAKVIVDQGERKTMIMEQLAAIEKDLGGTIIEDPELLETVANIVEFPHAIVGSFDKDFLKLPEEVLISVMRHHQKYFCLRDSSGALMANFITVNNTVARDPEVVVKGNQRVLLARLNDAKFFYQEDLKVPLDEFVERLKKVVFQAKLGTSHEKVERFKSLAEFLAEKLSPEQKVDISRTAKLCKADLESNMVCEFSDLQGIMGREYARVAGEADAVAIGIHEHYMPTGAGGTLPSNDCGAIVGIADKIDTITGCFGINLQPTGSADPYALRRQALGIINICLDRSYNLSLQEVVTRATELLQSKIEQPADTVVAEVIDFIKGRLFHSLTANKIPAGVIEAVLATGFDDIVTTVKRINALDRFRHRDDFTDLLTAFKRIMNITRKEKTSYVLNADNFTDSAETELYNTWQQIAGKIDSQLDNDDYDQALTTVADLRKSVDNFFNEVMVMADDQAVRENRLALLQGIAGDFKKIADFAKL